MSQLYRPLTERRNQSASWFTIAVMVTLAMGCSRSANDPSEPPSAERRSPPAPAMTEASSEEGYVAVRGENLSSFDEVVARQAELLTLDGKQVEVDGILHSGPPEVKNPAADLCGVSLDLESFAPWDGCRVVIRGKLRVIDWDAMHDDAEEDLGGPTGKEVTFGEIHRITIYPLQGSVE